jgi:hypothetical protein
MKDFPTLIKRIAGAGLPHGADILIQLHERMLKQHYPRVVSPKPAPPKHAPPKHAPQSVFVVDTLKC